MTELGGRSTPCLSDPCTSSGHRRKGSVIVDLFMVSDFLMRVKGGDLQSAQGSPGLR